MLSLCRVDYGSVKSCHFSVWTSRESEQILLSPSCCARKSLLIGRLGFQTQRRSESWKSHVTQTVQSQFLPSAEVCFAVMLGYISEVVTSGHTGSAT